MELLAYLGMGVSIIGGIWFVIVAFTESILWGLGCLLLAPISLVFLIMHWQQAKNPFFVQLSGLGLIIVATMLGGGIH